VPGAVVHTRVGDIGARLTVEQIARRLNVGRQAVYAMLEQGIMPGIRMGKRWLITRYAYEEWERNCGTSRRCTSPGLPGDTEVRC
jgi:excisionase family DNA binding protein